MKKEKPKTNDKIQCYVSKYVMYLSKVRHMTRPLKSFLFLFFADSWEDRWIESTHQGTQKGKFIVSAGKFYGDAEKDKGEQIKPVWHTHQC